MKKILIVDDQVEIRKLVEVTLGSGGYQIFQAESGEEAIEIARAEKPHLIIMDIIMPEGIDGITATHILKNDPETKQSTILMLTGRDQEADREMGLQAGADGYFVKPFSPLELIKKVEEVLG
ncbi:MAG: response regulator [Deltaproteobacteria bacterium]|nr:response regulator [Deltaproteobacteria bacterium]MBW2341284.1 response regulator [Deltaproteobacteria bacterium]